MRIVIGNLFLRCFFMTTNNRQAGFTLIEIMVVVVVIALLGAMIGPTLFKKVQQAEETRVAQDIQDRIR